MPPPAALAVKALSGRFVCAGPRNSYCDGGPVDSREFPLLIFDPRKGSTIKERLSLQGNPAVKDDWYVNPKTKEPVTFIDFARSEGRFAKHFDKDGNASPTLLWAKQERLENWHLLQELAGAR